MDTSVIAKAYVDHGDGILQLCYSFTKDYDEAEDLKQEVFIKAYKNIDKFRGDSSLFTWLYTIAKNLCISNNNKKKTQIDYTDKDVTKVSNEDPSDYAMTEEMDNKLKTVSLDARETFELYAFEGKSYKEIADIMNIKLGTVKSRISRVREKLSEL